MIHPQTIIDVRNELPKIEAAMKQCEDDCGVVYPYRIHTLNELVELREATYKCIRHLESYGVGV